jgi:hypothetical protein
MLIHLGGSLPNEVLRPALDLLVQNLLMTDTKAYQVQAQMFACDGREVKADNAIDAVLLRLAALMNRVEPELAQQLQTGRPALRSAIDRDNGWVSARSKDRTKSPEQPTEEPECAVASRRYAVRAYQYGCRNCEGSADNR